MERQRNTKRGSSTIRLSTDPQSVAARQRRHRISDRFRILRSLVPGGSKMDTVSMLEEAINYVKLLQAQIWLHQAAIVAPSYVNNMDQHEAPLNFNPILSNNYDAAPPLLNHEEVASYELPPPPPTLAPFPYCSFEEEEGVYINDNFS